MARLAIAVLIAVTGCTSDLAPARQSDVAPGARRLPNVGTGTAHHAAPKHRPRSRVSPASRSLRRPALGSRLQVTAYCPTGSRNAAGNWPTVGTAAANAFPLGTRLRVEGFGVVTVADRSAVGSTELDLFFGDDPGCEARAVAFGRRTLLVWQVAA